MKRTQLYLEEDLWKVLEIRAKESGDSISELVRKALREKYFDRKAERKQAMLGIIGIRANRPEFGDVEAYIRHLRQDTRHQRWEQPEQALTGKRK